MPDHQACDSAPEETKRYKITTHRNKSAQPAKPETEHVNGCSTLSTAAVAVTFKDQLLIVLMAN
jgi:hypothetical protein